MSRPFVKWIAISEQRIPVTQVVATQGSRVEPLTYFISVGDRVVEPNTSRKIAQLSYGLKGQIPDGLLVRVSSIDAETDKAFEIQKDFLLSLHGSLNAEKRQAVFGTP
jgi:EpsI family protein